MCRILLIIGMTLAFPFACAWADISPTQYVGYGISPIEAHGMRMVSAQVDILWGTPCTLSATFIIDNQNAKPTAIQLGFPITDRYDLTKEGKVPVDLTFAFDDVPIDSSSVTVDAQATNKPAYSTWYRCRHTFQPGRTKVAVKTKLPASLDYTLPYREHLFYCIETGGSWDGSIGSEEVAIHFPDPVARGEVIEANPSNYRLDGNIVRWQFKDFKPKGQDHDIEIEYLRPDVVSTLARARADCANDPANPSLILKLAKDLFALGPDKGYAPYPPSNLSRGELDDLVAKIKNNHDRARFQSFYSINAKGTYDLSESEWDSRSNENEILRILNAIDYQPPRDRSAYVDEARGLIEKLLKNQPSNSEAWNLYFANYYRFHFAGGPYEIGDPTYYPHEIEQIKKAVALCPQDTCLKLWHKVITNPKFQDCGSPNVVALFQQMKKQGILDNDYAKLKYDYY